MAEKTDVKATNVSGGDDLLQSIMNSSEKLGAAWQNITNQYANLNAQNQDIASGRWTLNNAAFQFGQLPPVSQAVLMGALAWVVLKLAKAA